MAAEPTDNWLPPGKRAAICLSVDDVHPGRSSDAYEAGGDLEQGVLGRLRALLDRHPSLHATLFVTPDWRPISVLPTRRLLARLPGLRDLFYLAPVRPAGSMALPRHKNFVEYLNRLPRTECALHGLHHAHRGPGLTAEFQGQSVRRCLAMLRRARDLASAAELRWVSGFTPPRWQLPANLLTALNRAGFHFVLAARDLITPISPTATTAMSGLHGLSLLHPQPLAGGIIHMPVNYQATSTRERARQIVEAGGLLSIKAHAAKQMLGHVMQDGLDEGYCDHLSALIEDLDQRFGDALWWTSMAAIARRARDGRDSKEGQA